MCCKDCFSNSFLKKAAEDLLQLGHCRVPSQHLICCCEMLRPYWPFMAILSFSIYFHIFPSHFYFITAVTASHCQVHSSTVPFCCNQRAGTSPGAGDHPDVFAHAGSTDWKLGCRGLGALKNRYRCRVLVSSRVCNESHWLFRLPFRGIISGTLNKMNEKTKDALSRYAFCYPAL